MAVGLVDPVDPFRGAYVALDYPGLAAVDDAAAASRRRGELFAELEQRDGLWVAAAVSRTRPDAGPYLSCRDTGWSADCGIGSWFASQEEAAELEQALADGGVAVVRIDARGRASVVDLR
jgi:uncharacterized membrane-anchored protein